MVPRVLVPVVLCLCLFWTLGAAQERVDLVEGDICKQSGGKTWTCKPVRSCPNAIRDLQKKKRPQFCRFTSTPVVCCEPSQSSAPTPPPPPPPPPHQPRPWDAGAKSKQKCKEYAEYVYVKTLDFLGTNYIKFDTCAIVEPLIIKGKNAESREYPHMALIGYGRGDSIEWLCGGSLISRRFVMSAAHCTDSGSKGVAKWVRLGEYNVASVQDERLGLAKSENFEIIESINHPEYRSSSQYNDIALYRLGKKVELSEYIRPACLNTADQNYKDFAIATGWGRTEWRGKGSDVLQKVNLSIWSADDCKEAFRSAIGPRLSNGIRDSSQFCAGDVVHGGDTSQGDSGGPLQVRMKTPYCMYSQIGITSFGAKNKGDKPGVYTRVSQFVPWIESVVWS